VDQKQYMRPPVEVWHTKKKQAIIKGLITLSSKGIYTQAMCKKLTSIYNAAAKGNNIVFHEKYHPKVRQDQI
jgi:hypothetical protein